MTDGMSAATREARAAANIEKGLAILADGLSEVFDPVFGGLPDSVREEMRKVLAQYGFDDIKILNSREEQVRRALTAGLGEATTIVDEHAVIKLAVDARQHYLRGVERAAKGFGTLPPVGVGYCDDCKRVILRQITSFEEGVEECACSGVPLPIEYSLQAYVQDLAAARVSTSAWLTADEQDAFERVCTSARANGHKDGVMVCEALRRMISLAQEHHHEAELASARIAEAFAAEVDQRAAYMESGQCSGRLPSVNREIAMEMRVLSASFRRQSGQPARAEVDEAEIGRVRVTAVAANVRAERARERVERMVGALTELFPFWDERGLGFVSEQVRRIVERPAPCTGGARWKLLTRTTPSGKSLFECGDCHRESAGPDKTCPPGVQASLYGYQVEGGAWVAAQLTAGRGALRCDEQGLGKTMPEMDPVSMAHRQALGDAVLRKLRSGARRVWFDEADIAPLLALAEATAPKRPAHERALALIGELEAMASPSVLHGALKAALIGYANAIDQAKP